jgi:DNA repair exonuclease SbcCD ATPase subunit
MDENNIIHSDGDHILHLVKCSGSISASQIAKKLNKSKSYINSMLDVLAENGLINISYSLNDVIVSLKVAHDDSSLKNSSDMAEHVQAKISYLDDVFLLKNIETKFRNFEKRIDSKIKDMNGLKAELAQHTRLKNELITFAQEYEQRNLKRIDTLTELSENVKSMHKKTIERVSRSIKSDVEFYKDDAVNAELKSLLRKRDEIRGLSKEITKALEEIDSRSRYIMDNIGSKSMELHRLNEYYSSINQETKKIKRILSQVSMKLMAWSETNETNTI